MEQDGKPEPGAMMLTEHRRHALWVQAPLLMLGAWLIASPTMLGYPSMEQSVSDWLSGLAIIVMSLLSFDTRRAWPPLLHTAVGIWLLFAPLVFWASTAAAYANDTLVGALVIGFALLVPMRMTMQGEQLPPGWSYNPSTWPQRIPIIALGFVSLLIAMSMAGYQLGYLPRVWEPFFTPGTPQVLTSEVSKAWPISDAGLGALVYLIETLSGLMGDERRWRTMPWMVAIFGLAVVPLGIVSIALVILQPLAVGTWCTLCLVTAFFMLLMIPLALDEIVAMCQFLARSVREGKPFWRTFFMGGAVPDGPPAARPIEAWSPAAPFWGMSLPWNLVGSAALGIWIMAAPALLGMRGLAADNDHLVGALVVTVSIIALAEVARAARFLNGVFGLWLIAATWFLAGSTLSGRLSDTVVGLFLVLLSFRRGPVRDRYGSWDRFVV